MTEEQRKGTTIPFLRMKETFKFVRTIYEVYNVSSGESNKTTPKTKI